jgi:succinyl-CoA:acetate CoA-transferase
MSADEAAAFIAPADHVGMSGLPGAGYPKEVPAALVRRVTDAAARGKRFTVSVWTGASMVWEGFFGHLRVAVVEVCGVTADGELVPSSSVGNNKTWSDLADLRGLPPRRRARK